MKPKAEGVNSSIDLHRFGLWIKSERDPAPDGKVDKEARDDLGYYRQHEMDKTLDFIHSMDKNHKAAIYLWFCEMPYELKQCEMKYKLNLGAFDDEIVKSMSFVDLINEAIFICQQQGIINKQLGAGISCQSSS